MGSGDLNTCAHASEVSGLSVQPSPQPPNLQCTHILKSEAHCRQEAMSDQGHVNYLCSHCWLAYSGSRSVLPCLLIDSNKIIHNSYSDVCFKISFD